MSCSFVWVVVCSLGGGVVAGAADTPLLSEDFESVPLEQLPAGWTIESATAPGGPAAWEGWKVKDIAAFRAAGGPRTSLHSGVAGRGAVADSDLYGTRDYDSSLITPGVDSPAGARMTLGFDSGYRHNSNQRADVDYRFGQGPWMSLLAWADGDGQHQDEQNDNRRIFVAVTNSGGSTTVQFRWRLRENFGWYWVIDHVSLIVAESTAHPPFPPVGLSPIGGQLDVPENALLDASVFADPDPSNTFSASQWELRADREVIHESGTVSGNSYSVPVGVLSSGQTVSWRVRYRDNTQLWSDWSEPAEFTVGTPSGTLFVNIQPASGVDNVSSRGGAWGDYDNDGFQDLWTGSVIYRNLDGSGQFSLVAGLPSGTSGSRAGTAWADFNNDGYLDLFVGSQWLYENQAGSGSFTLRSASFGLAGSFASQAVCWADMDNDGWVDVYAVGDSGAEGALYRNLGGQGFADVTHTAGVNDPLEGYGGAWADVDNDGDVDLFVANCGSQDRRDSYFENQGDGTFVERGDALGIRSPEDSWASAWGDYDNDGDLDLYVVSTSSADHFYRNDNGVFTELIGQAGIPNGSNREAVWADFDNDGDLDLYLCRLSGPNLLFRNDGNTQFVEVGAEWGVDDGGSGRVASVADMDNDGDLDIFIGNSGATPLIYRNGLGPSHWLILRLVGTTCNRSAIGARVYLTTGATTQMREVSGGGGLYTQPMLPVHFGLGEASTATVRIRWPGGAEQTLSEVQDNQILTVVEPPTLELRWEENQWFLIWYAWQTFELQKSETFAPGSWVVAGTPETTGAEHRYVVTVSQESVFYRLRLP